MKKLIFLIATLALTQLLCAQVRLPNEPKQPSYHDYSLDDSGSWCAIEATGSSTIILDKRNAQRVSFAFSGGYRFNEYFRLGCGIGGACYVNGNNVLRKDKNEFTMPIFIDLRGNILSQQIREVVPYWSVDIGSYLGDGFFFSPTLGMRIGQFRNALLLGLNYNIGEVKRNKHIYPSGATHFLGLKIGYEF